MTLTKIISGGQTGADQGGLEAAEALGLQTGGCMPRGFRTEAGFNRDLGEYFQMTESYSFEYAPRTQINVERSDGTLIFGDINSAGSLLTLKYCLGKGKPNLVVPWPVGVRSPLIILEFENFLWWLKTENISILNVAGNRESRNLGTQEACKNFLISALTKDKK